MSLRRNALLVLALATAIAATSGCASKATSALSGPTSAVPSAPATAHTADATTTAATDAAATTAHTAAPASHPSANHPSAKPADPDAISDSYAWKHPCDPAQLTTKVTENAPGSHDGVRVVTVTNTGPKACGLSYYPAVVISDSTSVGPASHPTRFVQPRPPGGLGGQPYVPVYAGRSQSAAIALNPEHSTDTSHAFDEIDVRPADFMPYAATVNVSAKDTPDQANPGVHDPVVTLYYATAAEAVGMLHKQG